LLVEDETAIQELLAYNLEQSGFNAMQALDATSAMSHITNSLPDLILLDWMLPGCSGIELTCRLRAEPRTRNIPIIMLTGRCEENDKLLGFESGVDDYITKPFSPRELIARIRAVLQSKALLSDQEIVHAGGLELSVTSHRVSAYGSEINLSPTEFLILHFFVTHTEIVYSRLQLIEILWGTQVNLEERTIDVHILRIRQALEPFGLDHLVQTVRGCGYRFSGNMQTANVNTVIF
jgi:two-component system phosphate regulon response regulator PhoB